MLIFFWCILILGPWNVISVANAKAKEKQKVAGDPPYNYNEIVRNMIRSWEAPVVYLRGRGFLPSDYQDTSKIKPSLDALMQRLDRGKREANINYVEEEAHSEIIRALSKEKKFGWNQLHSLSGKLTGNKGKPDERAARLLAMKRRLEELHCGVNFSPQLPDIQMSAKVEPIVKAKEPSEPKYDDTLQRMIQKTNPHSGRLSSFSYQYPKAPPSTDESPVTSAPISLSTYGALSYLSNRFDNSEIHTPKSSPPEAQEGSGKEASPSLRPGLGAPKYLSWDMKTGRLDNFSRSEKEAYLNKLLKAYSRNSMETRNPSELAEFLFPHLRNSSMSQRPFGGRANAR